MRKCLIFIVGLFIFQNAWCQEIVILSYKYDSTDVSAIETPKYDLNDELCALVILTANGVDEFELKGPIVNRISCQNTHYIYLPNKTKRVTIYHQDYLPLTISFNELFNTSSGLKKGKTYYINIEGGREDASVLTKKKYTNGSNYLGFEAKVSLTRLVVNGQEWQLQNGKVTPRMVRCGEYTYSASANGYQDVSGVVTVDKSFEPVTVSIQFDKQVP